MPSSSQEQTFTSTPRGGPLPDQTPRRRFRLYILQLISFIISNSFLVVIVMYGLIRRSISYLVIGSVVSPTKRLLNRPIDSKQSDSQIRQWDDPIRWSKEKVLKDHRYYAREAGYEIVDQEVETSDGYMLRVWKVVLPHRPDQTTSNSRLGGYPVLIQHGLFQSAGSFITSEERSLAFWLAEHGGYQVYLGNNRGLFNMGHRKYERGDPRFWDFNIKELALYDLPALVDHVLKDSGHSSLAFIGHSQGNATMFCSLAKGMIPSIGSKISCFIALAPAVYSGPLTQGFPFGLLKSMRWRSWRRVFGILQFLPIMSWCVEWLPSSVFGFLGYQMFAFLFNWTDRNWLLRRKTKMFRFTPSPVSSASIFWWTGFQGFSTKGCVLDPKVETWWDERFPPLALYSGGRDKLVLTEPLLKRIEMNEKTVKLIRHYKLKDGEHCDHFWHVDAVELCFKLMIEDIESTKPKIDSEYERRMLETRERENQRTASATDDLKNQLIDLNEDQSKKSSSPETTSTISTAASSSFMNKLAPNAMTTTSRIRNSVSEGFKEEDDMDNDLIGLRSDKDKGQVPIMDFDREVF
ncbi:triacylglycerol lipase [Phakopsora pachyrhizi]|nr:triacylglycerol lipase [Phakopsora pachyrhizi]